MKLDQMENYWITQSFCFHSVNERQVLDLQLLTEMRKSLENHV